MEMIQDFDTLSLNRVVFFTLGKLKGRYLLLELLLYLDEPSTFKILHKLSSLSRRYLTEMYRYIKKRGNIETNVKC